MVFRDRSPGLKEEKRPGHETAGVVMALQGLETLPGGSMTKKGVAENVLKEVTDDNFSKLARS